MSQYRYGKYGSASRSSKAQAITTVKVVFWTLVLLVPAVVYIIVTSLSPPPATGRKNVIGYFDPNTTIQTEWFSFKVENSWQEVSNLTIKDKVYYYREMNGAMSQGLLAIYVNSEPVASENYFTHVVPVKTVNDRTLSPLGLEPHCDPPATQNKTSYTKTTMGGVTFMCWSGASAFYAVAGEVNGTPKVTLKRDNSETAEYIITYRNTGYEQNNISFSKLLATFSAR